MTKKQLIERLVRLLAPHNLPEQARLKAHHAKRHISQVRESLARWQAIAATSQGEINRHCQFDGLPRMG